MALSGRDLLNNPVYNKGTAFTDDERTKYKLQGLLPSVVESLEQQLVREKINLDGQRDPMEKYCYLMELLSRNETLFYRLALENIYEVMPIVYTPTVGSACIHYSKIFTKPRGIYLQRSDAGNIREILGNWWTKDIKAIVFTDGERILGLGDQGVDGMGIPVGKLQLYSVCAGINPSQCLPVVIDNGTVERNYLPKESGDLKTPQHKEKNEDVRLYMGSRTARRNDASYYDFVREFMEAAKATFGESVLIQFEDFGNETAFKLLEDNRHDFNCFNDDIQGTACVALAGVLASLKVPGATEKLKDHRVLFLGAGEAGTGIAELVAYAIAEETKCSLDEARKNIFFVDSQGLVNCNRDDFKSGKMKHHKIPFAHDVEPCETLLEAVQRLRPTMLVGVSATPKTFTREIIEMMAEINEVPIIFALSNPTSRCECTAAEAYEWTDGRCVFASGSPFGRVTVETSKGRQTFEPGQGNNAYIFPGLGLGVIAAQAKEIPEELFYLTAQVLANEVTEDDLKRGSVYPQLERIRIVSEHIAVAVAKRCFMKGLARAKEPKVGEFEAWIRSMMDDFEYKPIPNKVIAQSASTAVTARAPTETAAPNAVHASDGCCVIS